MSSEINSDISKCPFHGEGIPQKHNSGKGQTNRDWWPNSLNLKILFLKTTTHSIKHHFTIILLIISLWS